ncbi:unnamed protein product [Prunus armeniaca]
MLSLSLRRDLSPYSAPIQTRPPQPSNPGASPLSRPSCRRDFLGLSRIFATVVLSPPAIEGSEFVTLGFGRIFRRLLSLWAPTRCRRVGYCSIGHWVPVQSPRCHERMSDLIRRRRVVTTTPSLEPPAQPASAATALALMEQDHAAALACQHHQHHIDRRYWCLGGTASQEEHPRAVSAAEDGEGHLEDLDEESLEYVNRLFGERYKQWKSNLHHHFEAFDDPQVALQEGCQKELEGQEDTQVNKGNRKKKTLLHHSGSRPFSYRMDARRQEGSKFPEIDVFSDLYVRPGNELTESLHTTMVERSKLVLQESASQLPPETPIEFVNPPQDAGFQILMQTLDQTLGRRPGTYCRGMGNARQREPRPRSSSQANNQVTVLTSQVAEHEGQMSVILQSLARSGIPIPNFGAPTSEPVHPSIPSRPRAL